MKCAHRDKHLQSLRICLPLHSAHPLVNQDWWLRKRSCQTAQIFGWVRESELVLLLLSFLVQIPACLSQETIWCNQSKSTTETSTLYTRWDDKHLETKKSFCRQNVGRRWWWVTLAGAGEGRRLTGSAGASLLPPSPPCPTSSLPPSLRSLPPSRLFTGAHWRVPLLGAGVARPFLGSTVFEAHCVRSYTNDPIQTFIWSANQPNLLLTDQHISKPHCIVHV